MPKPKDWIVVGRFGRPHGIKGFIVVQSFTEPRDNLLQYKDWHAHISGHWQPLKILQIEASSNLLLAKIEGYEIREHVAQLTNTEIAVNLSELPELPAGEFYWHELVGMQVVNKDGSVFGKVIEIMPTGANDVLVVEGEKRYLIPYLLDQYVLSVDMNQGIITVDWDMDF